MEECLDKKSLCVPPGRWRGESQCTARKLIRFEEPGKTKRDTCSVLGLTKCTCPYHENSVQSCEDEVFCRRQSSSCLPVSEWASRIFQEVQVRIRTFMISSYNLDFQDYIYRNCWTGFTLLNCVTSTSKWRTLLADLEQYKVASYGKVKFTASSSERKLFKG